MPKVRNILIFVAIAAVFTLAYIFLKPEPADDLNLVSTSSTGAPILPGSVAASTSTSGATLAAGDFLTLLLNVKNIKLEDSIFSDPAFQGLRDSSIILMPDGNEGRPNPFAPLGQDIITAPVTTPPLPTAEEEMLPAPGENPSPGVEGETFPGAGTI